MAANYLLKVQDIDGESQIKGHENEIELQSFSWGGTQLGTWHEGGGGGGGKANVGDMSFAKLMDKASATLFQRCLIGKHIPEAKLFCLRVSGDAPIVYLEITMKKVIVSSVSWSGGGSSELPTEMIGFNFAQVEWEWKVQEESGVAGAGNKKTWDVPKNAES